MSFSPEALDFLRRLEENNERAWFHAHRDDYDRLLLEPARTFVESFGELSERLGEGVDADPRVGRSKWCMPAPRIRRSGVSRNQKPGRSRLGPGPCGNQRSRCVL